MENGRRDSSLRSRDDRRFVAVAGLPGSGKTRLAHQLSPLLGLPVIDKDDILERLFDSKGLGDAAWRRTLSRESDAIFRREAEASEGALIVSFWRLPGMPPNSGTPTDWLIGLSNRLVTLYCKCPEELAASRFFERTRHPGHLDSMRSREQVFESIRNLTLLEPLRIGVQMTVDTSCEIRLADVASEIASQFSTGTFSA